MPLVNQQKLILKILFVVFVLFAISIYSYLKMRNLILGPTITVSSPENGQTVGNSTTVVEGMAKNVSFLSLNDRPIFVDEKGNFKEVVALLPGYNILSVKGADRFGKKTESVVQLVLKE